MDNSIFSSLLYRIIGKPESWQDDYIDIVHKIVDETESFDDPDNYSELAIGGQILRRMSDTNETLMAFSTLLDKSRFKMIILDEHFKPIHCNQNAKQLHDALICPNNPKQLNLSLLEQLKCAKSDDNTKVGASGLIALDYKNREEEQIYLRSIKNHNHSAGKAAQFNLLLMLDQSRQQSALNADLVARYELTDKEQMVLIQLIHGKSIKTIASESFVSDNTIKTHLKSLFRKTDTKSQTDLVGLVLTHESQILDSYFDTTSGSATAASEHAKDLIIMLDDNTKIVYREYGPRDGYPIVMCHNGYGCRTSIPPNYAAICRKHKRRIIIPDRPGFGQTPLVKGHPKRWSEQLNEFIDKLKLDDYDVLGNVLGCPIAIDFASQADHRLKRLILASPILVNKHDDGQYLHGVLAPSIRLVRASERFARETYELWLRSVSLNLNSYYRNMLEASFGEAERDTFARHKVTDAMVEAFREGSANTLNGISNEMVFCMTPRGLDLSKITIPVNLWWGSEDNRYSKEGVENLAAQFPNSTTHLKQGYSEHIYYALFEEIIA